MGRMRSHHSFLLAGAAASALIIAGTGFRPASVAAAASGYEEVKGWPSLPAGVEMGEAAGVAVDNDGHVLVFHRPGRGFDTAATELLKDPAILAIDQQTGTLVRSWGANTFLVPHGITVDQANNVFLTDVACNRYSFCTTAGCYQRMSRASQVEQRISISPPILRSGRSFYVPTVVNSRVAIFDSRGKWLRGKEGRRTRRVQ